MPTTTTLELGKKVVELCRAGKSMEAINTLYAPNIVSIRHRPSELALVVARPCSRPPP
jgi:hypothetical protein